MGLFGRAVNEASRISIVRVQKDIVRWSLLSSGLIYLEYPHKLFKTLYCFYLLRMNSNLDILLIVKEMHLASLQTFGNTLGPSMSVCGGLDVTLPHLINVHVTMSISRNNRSYQCHPKHTHSIEMGKGFYMVGEGRFQRGSPFRFY